jgi:hypothetical protein
MPTEEWRPVPGFRDYEVSSLGQIASIKRGSRQILAGGKTEMGYRNVLLYTNGHRVGRRVHQIVALAFLGPRPDGLEIRHLDGNKLNNALNNLAYGTHEENLADQRRHRGLLLIVGADPVRRYRQRDAGSQTHCTRGHERSEANTYVYPDGKQRCRPCKSQDEMASRRRRAFRAAGIERAA